MTAIQHQTGKLIMRYVGKRYDGRHTEVLVDGRFITGSYNCDKSIMLLIWCVCDMNGYDILDYINSDFVYEETLLGERLCKSLYKPTLFSKYDIMMTHMATANAYKDCVYKPRLTIDQALSARRDIVLHTQKKFNIRKLEVVYELDEHEIWTRSRV